MVITHNGAFHTDDVFAVATLFLLLEKKYKLKVIRTRDPKIIEKGDYVVDVGARYKPSAERFDHHQESGAGKRANGISYASFGLVWKKYGAKVAGLEELAQKIDRKLIQPIDAMDNGEEIIKPVFPDVFPYTIQDIVSVFNPTWKEGNAGSDAIFLKFVDVAKAILSREITREKLVLKSRIVVEKLYRDARDKRIIVMDDEYPWQEILGKYKEPLYVIYPESKNETWIVGTVRDNTKSFVNRKDLPLSWAGKGDEELQKITGVPDAIFCHNKRFIAAAKSKEGALKLAKLALRS